MLYIVRRVAGLPEKAKRYGGRWEGGGINGHSLGHYLTALAACYAATGDARAKERVDYIVDELAKRTVDSVEPGFQQSEVNHDYSGEHSDARRDFADVVYPLPRELTKGKKTVKVEFRGNERTFYVGGLFGLSARRRAGF